MNEEQLDQETNVFVLELKKQQRKAWLKFGAFIVFLIAVGSIVMHMTAAALAVLNH